jgi:hypothetical protein
MWARSGLGWGRCHGDAGWPKHSMRQARCRSWSARRGSFDIPRWGSPLRVGGQSRRCRWEHMVVLRGGDRSTDAHQIPMPAEQRFWLDKEAPRAPATKESAQSGEQRPVAGPQRRTGHLAAEHRDLMTEHDDFDRQFVAVTPREPEQLERSDEGQVEEGQRHGPALSLSSRQRKSS